MERPNSRRFGRSMPWLVRGVAAAFFVGLTASALPVQAQNLGGFGQRRGGGSAPQQSAPQQSAPQFQRPPIQQQPQYSQRQPIQQQPIREARPVYNPPTYNPPSYNRNAPIYNRAPVYNPPTVREQSINPARGIGRPSGSLSTQTLPPALTYRRSGTGRVNDNGIRLGTGSLRSTRPQDFSTARRNDNGPTYDNRRNGNRPIRITTPVGQRAIRRGTITLYSNPAYVNSYVNPGFANGPALLGGYYYGNYCDTYFPNFTYPSVYSYYDGFPQYIFNPSVIVLARPYYPAYCTPYLPFYAPQYQATYNQYNYYVTSPERAADIEAGGSRAKSALKSAYPAGSFQAAFADIEHAWNEGSVALISKHLRDNDTKISVFLKQKYTYSLASGDFAQITRDAMDRLQTVSFEFTRVRKAKNGDVTAYGKHVYRVSDSSGANGPATLDNTVPLDQSADQSSPYDKANDPAVGEEKTVYVSYTLRHEDDQWYIIATGSAPTNMISANISKAAGKKPA